jgi:adenylate cyclase
LANIFISYERSALATVQRVQAALIEEGYTVWTDAQLPAHRTYAEVIEERLAAADAVLVLWSGAAARSTWVRAEAEHARSRGRLVQLTLDGALPPMPFNQIQCADLAGWTGDPHAAGWRKILASLELVSGDDGQDRAPSPAARENIVAPTRRLSRRLIVGGAAAAIVLVAAIIGSVLLFTHHAAPPDVQGRVAILPFEALSDTPQARDIAKSLSTQILTTLNGGQIPAVSQEDVAASHGPDSLARLNALGAAVVLGGTVQDDGKSIDLKVRLDDPIHHLTLWTGDTQGDSADAAPLQLHAAKMVARVLACSNRALRPSGLRDPALLSRYLHACDLFANNDVSAAANMFQLFSSLRTVIEGAPNFIPARTDLAKFEAFLAPNMPPETAATQRQDAVKLADEALRLQPNLPDAYLAKEMVMPPTDWAAREAMLRKAVAADPDWPHTNGFLAFLLQETGRMQEAKLFGARAAAADLQIDWRNFGAAIACDAGDYEPSTSIAQDQLKKQPDDQQWRRALRTCLLDAFRFGDLRLLYPLKSLADRPAAFPLVLKALQTQAPADREAARRSALAIAKSGNAANAIQLLSLLGYIDDSFALADQMAAGYPGGGDGSITLVLFQPPAEAMRRDPRFIRLAKRLQIAAFWKATGRWPDFCADPKLPYNCRTEVDRWLKT